MLQGIMHNYECVFSSPGCKILDALKIDDMCDSKDAPDHDSPSKRQGVAEELSENFLLVGLQRPEQTRVAYLKHAVKD